MDNDKILDYVMNSPANTNPNVLKTMLDSGGSGGGVLVIEATGSYEEGYTLDKTYKEISDAFKAGEACVVHYDDLPYGESYATIVSVNYYESTYNVNAVFISPDFTCYGDSFSTNSENGYPNRPGSEDNEA